MNMISTGAFLTEMDASTKQNELVKKLTAAWEKKNSKVGRAGGVSLMALSLAACGSDDDTPFSSADVSAAEAAATTAALTGADGTVYASVDAAVTSNDTAIADAARAEGVASVDITTDNAAATNAAVAADTAFASLADLVAAYNGLASPTAASLTTTTATQNLSTSMTTSSDTVTAATGTVGAGDVIADPSATDNDTMTIAHSGATLASTGVISNVENITINAASTTTFTVTDASGVTGGAVTVNLTTPGGATAATVSDIGSNTSVIAGSRVATLTVDTGGDRSDLTVTGGTGATTVNGSQNKLTTATIDASAGTNVNVELGAESSGITITAGSGTVDINDGTGVETTNLTLNAATATTVTADFAADSSNINLTTGTGNVVINDSAAAVNTGLVIDASVAEGTMAVSLADGSDVTVTAGTDSGAITIDSTSTAATTDDGSTITITADAADIAAGITDFDTVNLTLNGTASTVTLDNSVYDLTVSATAAAQTVRALTESVDGTITINGAFAVNLEMDVEDADGTDTLSIVSDGAAAHFLEFTTNDQTADVDLTGVDTDVAIQLNTAMAAGTTGEFTLASGATVQFETAQTNNLGFTASAANSTATVDITTANNSGTHAFTNMGTLTITADGDNANAHTFTVDSDTAGTQGAIAVTGSSNISLAGATDASSVDASALTGDLTAVLSATVDTITGGSGDDSVTMYDGDMTLDGGAGDDTLVATAVDVSDDTVSISNVEVVSMTTVDATFKVGQLGGSETITGTTGDLTITGTAAAGDTIDLSGFTNGLTQGSTAAADTDRDGTNDTAAGGFIIATGLAGNDTITGGSSNNILDGGAGNDTITAGNGQDYVTGGTGGDTIVLTEATADSSADFVIITAMTDGSADGVAGGTFSSYDTITGFLSGTDFILGDTNNAGSGDTIGTALFSASAVSVQASTAATLAGSDLTATTALNVDDVVAFLADATVAAALGSGAGYAANEKELLAVTDATSDQTFLYALESSDTTFTADEINLLAVIDDQVVAADLIIA